MALIIVVPLLIGVVLAGRYWHRLEEECLKQRARWREFYNDGRMTQEISALREVDR